MRCFRSKFCSLLGCKLFRVATLALLLALFVGSTDNWTDYTGPDSTPGHHLSLSSDLHDNSDGEEAFLMPENTPGQPVLLQADAACPILVLAAEALFRPDTPPPILS